MYLNPKKCVLNLIWQYLPPQQTTFQVDVTYRHIILYRYTESLRQKRFFLMHQESFESSVRTTITPSDCRCQTRPFKTHKDSTFLMQDPYFFSFLHNLYPILHSSYFQLTESGLAPSIFVLHHGYKISCENIYSFQTVSFCFGFLGHCFTKCHTS